MSKRLTPYLLYFLKGELHAKHKLLSYERAFKMLKNDMCITSICESILELRGFKDEQGHPQTSRKMSFSDFVNSPVMPKMM